MTTVVVGGAGAIGSAVVASIRGEGATAHVLDRQEGIDAADPDQMAQFVKGLDDPPTRLVHVAGSVGHGGVLETSLESWRKVVDDNLTSAFVACRAVLPAMTAAGDGVIVLTSSVNGRHGGNTLSGPAYAAAKAGVIALARNIAKEFGPQGVRANVVAPGPVASDMTERLEPAALERLAASAPVGRIATPTEVAAAICYLLDPSSAYVNGAVLDINGGMWMG